MSESPEMPERLVRGGFMRGETVGEGVTAPAHRVEIMVPQGWADYPLTDMMSKMEEQGRAAFATCRDDLQPILDVDALFFGRSDVLFEPVPESIAGALLFVRMCSVSRAAARLVFSSQDYEAKAVLRSALECAVYAWAVSVDATMRSAWAHRDDDERSRDRVRGLFGWGRLMQRLEGRSTPLAGQCRALYDELIDFGAHPNAGGIIDNISIVRGSDGRTRINTRFGGGHPDNLRSALRHHLRVLHLAFELAKLTWPAAVDRMGSRADVERIFAERELALTRP